MGRFTFLIFTFMTICCWGLYGPTLHIAQESMVTASSGGLARFKPFMGVGFAYFVIAVIYPAALLYFQGEKGAWSLKGIIFSFIAGCFGALGALGIILSFNLGGRPIFVMPLVFGCAPVVNTFVSALIARSLKEASLVFYIGVVVVAIGAAGVLAFKPSEKKAEHDESGKTTWIHNSLSDVSFGEQQQGGSSPVEEESAGGGASHRQEEADSAATAGTSGVPAEESLEIDGEKALAGLAPAKPGLAKRTVNWMAMVITILLTACCWGSYGPTLHVGQGQMSGSRLRPFLCVGLAYFVVAVLIPIPFLANDPGELTIKGSTWALLAGTAGAMGALGIIFSFNFGGRPIFVMPLVFGLAPVVNTLSTTLMNNLWGQIGWPFKISLMLVILGAVTVLTTAPRPKPSQPKQARGK